MIITWDDDNYIELRKSYEIDNCVCLKFLVGYLRVDYQGLEKDKVDIPLDFGNVIGVDFIEV
jgi:hypothetical protein